MPPRTFYLAACFLLSSVLALCGEGELKPDSLAARLEQQATPLNYEPWIKAARVGDYIVRKFPSGSTVRTEVREIDSDFVYVDEVTDAGGHKTERKRKYTRNAGTLKPREVEMKSTGTFKQKINGVKMNCEAFDGYIITLLKEWNGETTAMKLAKYHKVVAEGVPFGGIVRELQAADDGIEVAPKTGGGFNKQYNKTETMQVTLEVTAWGNSVDEKKR